MRRDIDFVKGHRGAGLGATTPLHSEKRKTPAQDQLRAPTDMASPKVISGPLFDDDVEPDHHMNIIHGEGGDHMQAGYDEEQEEEEEEEEEAMGDDLLLEDQLEGEPCLTLSLRYVD